MRVRHGLWSRRLLVETGLSCGGAGTGRPRGKGGSELVTPLIELAALFFARAAVAPDSQGTGLAQLRLLLTLAQAFFGFPVQLLCFGRTAAHITERFDHYSAQVVTTADLQLVTHPHFAGRLAAFAMAMHLASLDGALGQAAGLEKTGGPEPLVNANLVHVVSI